MYCDTAGICSKQGIITEKAWEIYVVGSQQAIMAFSPSAEKSWLRDFHYSKGVVAAGFSGRIASETPSTTIPGAYKTQQPSKIIKVSGLG